MSQANYPGCVLQAVQVKGCLQGLLGAITIAQTYQNAEPVNIEAAFTFPVPAEAVLLGVEIRINDRQLQGRVLPKRPTQMRSATGIAPSSCKRPGGDFMQSISATRFRQRWPG